MSVVVPIESIPNQSLSIQIDEVRYGIRFRDIGGMMSTDISIDDQTILEGQRVVGGFPLIPYKYLEGDGGNFIFLTELGDLVYWDQFGVTQSLLYFSDEELEAVRAD
jgi:hypothetical protein